MMKLIALAAVAVLALPSGTAQARHRAKPNGWSFPGLFQSQPTCGWFTPCKVRHRHHRHRVAQERVSRHRHATHHLAHRTAPRDAATPRSLSLDGVIPALSNKVQEIISTCGSHVISAVRHTFIAGTRIVSLHASGRAVDVSGNPTCIYSMLHGWPGGYSIDYARVGHVHISLGGREDGARFVHGGGRYARRYAHRHLRHHRHHLASG